MRFSGPAEPFRVTCIEDGCTATAGIVQGPGRYPERCPDHHDAHRRRTWRDSKRRRCMATRHEARIAAAYQDAEGPDEDPPLAEIARDDRRADWPPCPSADDPGASDYPTAADFRAQGNRTDDAIAELRRHVEDRAAHEPA